MSENSTTTKKLQESIENFFFLTMLQVKCSECGLLFLTTEELNAHDCVDEGNELDREPRRKIPSAASTFKCAICKGTFDSHDGFKDHDCKKSHKCTTCGQTFDKSHQLAKHMESTHGTPSTPALDLPLI